MTNLSVALIARDRAAILPQCLACASQVSDDVVIVTNADHKFINYSDQKNYAVSKCKHDWILSLDADEWLSSGLIQEISNLKFQTSNYSAYSMPRLNYIFGKPIYHSDWSPESDRHVWLFRKSKSTWVNAVHEQVKVNGQIGNLVHPKIHQNYQTVEQFLVKMNDYTSFEAQNRKFAFPLVFMYPVWKFVRHYFVFMGFLDGWHGLFLSYLQAIYGLQIYVKAWQKTKSS